MSILYHYQLTEALEFIMHERIISYMYVGLGLTQDRHVLLHHYLIRDMMKCEIKAQIYSDCGPLT